MSGAPRTAPGGPVASGHRPRPGDVAVYGLGPGQLYATHLAIVVSFPPGAAGPTAVNGDRDVTAFSIVELLTKEYQARSNGTAPLSGYVIPG